MLSLAVAGVLTLTLSHIMIHSKNVGIRKRTSSLTEKRLSYFMPTTDNCSEHRRVAFLKVHKAGSTTVMNILQRFGEKRSLTCAIPGNGNYLGYGVTIEQFRLIKPPRNQSYDMLYNHVVYNRNVFRKVMPNDTLYIAIVREPLDLLDSAIRYLQKRFPYIAKIPEDKLTNFLSNPNKFEAPLFKNSFTNNRIAFDFGLNVSLLHDRAAIRQYLTQIDLDFQLVMILEYFDESLILLKRLLCWNFKDILYITANNNKNRTRIPFSQINQDNFRKWGIADIMFYDHFYQKFFLTVNEQGIEFYKEVKQFKSVIHMTTHYCNSNITLPLVIPPSAFNNEFTVDSVLCNFMKIPELEFMEMVQKRHFAAIKRGKH